MALAAALPLGLLGLAVAAVIVVIHRHSSAGRSGEEYLPRCVGFTACPPYPEPLPYGTWPSAYNASGGFPPGFIWGLGTASYQIEGAYREGGRGASIWDTFSGANTVGMPGANCSYCCKEAPCPVNPAMFAVGATGNVADDHYHMFKNDIALMKSMGLKHYRFSIAWPRMVPTGRIADGVNEEAKTFYNALIDGLLAEGITPYVTLYHWDLPQGLFSPPDRMGWWSVDAATGEPNGAIQDEFVAFADVCFKEFGDRVKLWITFNEGWTFTYLASNYGKAPTIKAISDQMRDPYIAAHNVLNAHAAAVNLYRTKYQPKQGGSIGITNNQDWREPKSTDPEDIAAAERTLEFQLGWWCDPIFGGKGDYPPAMRVIYGDRLPKFTPEQSQLINMSADFFGLNHYGTGWAEFSTTPGADSSYAKVTEDGPPFGFVKGQSGWLYGSGWGFRKLLNWVDKRYNRPIIYVTESGWSLAADSGAEEGANDPGRVAYYANYTTAMQQAIHDDGVDVRGFFAWSLMDNYEWERGYIERFGTSYNDFAFGFDPNGPDNSSQPTAGQQKRRRKTTSCWLEAVWTGNSLVDPNGPSFTGCVTSAVFNRTYSDPRSAGCSRQIFVNPDGLSGRITGKDKGLITLAACDGITDWAWMAPVPATFSGGSIVADFSSRGGPEMARGYWSRATESIDWEDGTAWTALEDEADDAPQTL